MNLFQDRSNLFMLQSLLSFVGGGEEILFANSASNLNAVHLEGLLQNKFPMVAPVPTLRVSRQPKEEEDPKMLKDFGSKCESNLGIKCEGLYLQIVDEILSRDFSWTLSRVQNCYYLSTLLMRSCHDSQTCIRKGSKKGIQGEDAQVWHKDKAKEEEGELCHLHLQGVASSSPRHGCILQGHVYHKFLCEWYILAHRRRFESFVALQQEVYQKRAAKSRQLSVSFCPVNWPSMPSPKAPRTLPIPMELYSVKVRCHNRNNQKPKHCYENVLVIGGRCNCHIAKWRSKLGNEHWRR